MQLSISWDLLIIVFFAVIMSYSTIVGQNGTLKIILSSYISLLTANGIASLFGKYLEASQPVVNALKTTPQENVVLLKVLLFVGLNLTLVLRGGFFVDVGTHHRFPIRILISTVLGVLSAGLIMSTVLVFLASSNADVLFLPDVKGVLDIPTKTLFVQSLIDYYHVWFAAPAIAFIVLSFWSQRSQPEAGGS